jgi:hypothetical protein
MCVGVDVLGAPHQWQGDVGVGWSTTSSLALVHVTAFMGSSLRKLAASILQFARTRASEADPTWTAIVPLPS